MFDAGARWKRVDDKKDSQPEVKVDVSMIVAVLNCVGNQNLEIRQCKVFRSEQRFVHEYDSE